MINREEALRYARQHLDCKTQRTDIAYVIISDYIEEKSDHWEIPFQSKEYLESGEMSHMLFGHGPLLVNKQNGEVIESGSLHGIEDIE